MVSLLRIKGLDLKKTSPISIFPFSAMHCKPRNTFEFNLIVQENVPTSGEKSFLLKLERNFLSVFLFEVVVEKKRRFGDRLSDEKVISISRAFFSFLQPCRHQRQTKTQSGRPDWANFLPSADGLLWTGVFQNYKNCTNF
jgi:hypothetical protein